MNKIFTKMRLEKNFDGTISFKMREDQFRDLRMYLEICDGILDNFIKIGLSAEQNALLKLDERDKKNPPLTNYCVYMEGIINLNPKDFDKIKWAKKQVLLERHYADNPLEAGCYINK